MIKREPYITELKKWIDKPQVKIITGIRRSGKSTLLQLLREELLRMGIDDHQIIALNFESFQTEALRNAKDLYHYVQSNIQQQKRSYILLDEIQEVADWEKLVNALLVDFDVDLYITGSNSNMLSSELSTYLAGRYIEIPVFTLSFSEYITFKQKQTEKAITTDRSLVMDYLRKGGFPVIHGYDYDEESAYKVINDIYSSVILRDTVQRHKIRDIELLERVIRFTFDNIGNTFSGKNIADYFKSQQRSTDINTIYNYLLHLQGAFLLYRVPRYDIKGKEILKTLEKYYVSDVSLIYATMGYRDRIISGIMENLVFLELKRKGYEVYIGKLGHLEIDFIAEKKGAKIYVQVAYLLESEQTVKREFTPLLSIKDQFPKYVVTLDEIWKDNIDGVRHVPLQDFLLMKEY